MDKDIRVVIVQDGDLYFAQCLEVNIAAQGTTRDEAMERLRIAFNAEARERGETIFDLGPAPEEYVRMYESEPTRHHLQVA
ncbi:hypothetical protein ABWH92_12380 [Ahrensia marina]|uniref:hypothetical protein n=1 Tax=Ahrensia marina TaxID=1514904 RepID=UPI0035D0D3D2